MKKFALGAVLVLASLFWAEPLLAQAKPDASSMKIKIDVVGFDIKPGSQEEKQLKEVASAGGGVYLPAADAAKLTEAFKTVVEKTIVERPQPPQKPAPPAPAKPPTPAPAKEEGGWSSVGQAQEPAQAPPARTPPSQILPGGQGGVLGSEAPQGGIMTLPQGKEDATKF